MKELLHYILTKLVEFPDEVVIELEELPELLRFHVKLNEADYSTIIGRSGTTIKAIQDILIVYSKLHNETSNRRIYINID